MDSSAPEHHKVIVLGAGINGIALAKTYLQIDPLVDILLVDREASIGGVWSKERIYPGLNYEIPTPMLNFSDLDMCEEFGMKKWEDVNGYRVNEFLVCYATKFDLIRRCRFNTTADSIERNGAGWKIMVQTTGQQEPLEALICDKLVIATGVTSIPHVPDFNVDSYNGSSFHSVEMGRRSQELTAKSVKHVTVVGGHKSALEVVGTCAQAGKKVEWLIRAEGGGPTWLFPSRTYNGTALPRMTGTRAMGFSTTSIYHSDRWLNRFLHGGRWWLGTWLITWFWKYMTGLAHGGKYAKSANGGRLKPGPKSYFWVFPGVSITYPRDLKTLKIIDEGKLVHVNRSHPVSAKGRFLTLGTGVIIATDAIVWCTGWEMSVFTLCEPDLANDIGFPILNHLLPETEQKYWKQLDAEAENCILELNPRLRNPPTDIKPTKYPITPFRLFRSLVPPKLAFKGDNSLVVIGCYANGRVQMTAELVSLWAVAYLEDLFPPATQALFGNLDEMNRDVAHVDAYRRKRFLDFMPYRLAIFEAGEFDDQLMGDLGLRADRKRLRMPTCWRGWFGLKAWFAEWFEVYVADDYKGIVQEFMVTVEKRKGTSSPAIVRSME